MGSGSDLGPTSKVGVVGVVAVVVVVVVDEEAADSNPPKRPGLGLEHQAAIVDSLPRWTTRRDVVNQHMRRDAAAV